MTSFDSLPCDVIDCILSCDSISALELCRLSAVSKFLNCIAKSNKLWKQKYAQKWPEISIVFDPHNTDWKNEYHLRYELRKLIKDKLAHFSQIFYHFENVTYHLFFEFKDICAKHSFGHKIIISELENIVYHSDSYLNLTQKYYAKKALRYMRHLVMEAVCEEFFSRPSDKLSLLEGASLISNWCQSTEKNHTQDVAAHISEIVQKVIEKLKELYSQHSIFKHNYVDFDGILNKSLWSSRECKQILYCLSHVMYEEMKFLNISGSWTLQDIYIDQVLTTKRGIDITLGIIYSTVAGKLGVLCLPIEFYETFYLKWHEDPELHGDDGYSFIDVANRGAFKQYIDLIEDLAPIDVFVRMIMHMFKQVHRADYIKVDPVALCEILEFMCFIRPHDEMRSLLENEYIELGISDIRVDSGNTDFKQQIRSHVIMGRYLPITAPETSRQHVTKVKKRMRDEPVEVKFAVGMIMRHKKYNYRCVIYGWDYTCEASYSWKRTMGVNRLKQKDKQPFYQVLVFDSTTRYAAQENLEMDHQMEPITHEKVGHYFESFHGSYYLPNEQTISAYPNDIKFREETLATFETAQKS